MNRNCLRVPSEVIPEVGGYRLGQNLTDVLLRTIGNRTWREEINITSNNNNKN